VARARTITIPVSRKFNRSNVKRLAVAWSFLTLTRRRPSVQPHHLMERRASTESRLSKKYSLWMRRLANCCGSSTPEFAAQNPIAVSPIGPMARTKRVLVGVDELRLRPGRRHWQTDSLLWKRRPASTSAKISAASPPALNPSMLTQPGIVLQDLVIFGAANPETLQRLPETFRAYDVRSGKLRLVLSHHSPPRRIRIRHLA